MDDTVFIRTCDGAVFDVPGVRYDTPNTEIELSNDLVIMQFTGLTDKNGVEIYEGDILEKTYLKEENYSSGEYVRSDVVFHEQSLCERFTHDNGKVYYGKINRDSFVAGNIYQNPELLK
jgi:uncharacterized phage protein (TIGR01671 family)